MRRVRSDKRNAVDERGRWVSEFSSVAPSFFLSLPGLIWFPFSLFRSAFSFAKYLELLCYADRLFPPTLCAHVDATAFSPASTGTPTPLIRYFRQDGVEISLSIVRLPLTLSVSCCSSTD